MSSKLPSGVICQTPNRKISNWVEKKHSQCMPTCQVLVNHTCNPCYLGGRDGENHSLKPAQANSLWDPISKIHNKKGWWSGSRFRPWLQTIALQKKKKTPKKAKPCQHWEVRIIWHVFKAVVMWRLQWAAPNMLRTWKKRKPQKRNNLRKWIEDIKYKVELLELKI
jgi:hypothetical protein